MLIITILLHNENLKQTDKTVDITTPTQVHKHALHVLKRAEMAHAILYLVLVYVSGLHCFQHTFFKQLINLYYNSIFAKQEVFKYSYIVCKIQSAKFVPRQLLISV